MSSSEIEQLRKKLSLSQEELAQLLGLAGRVIVYRWESGLREPSEVLRRLFCYLNDLSKEEALQLLNKLATYAKKKKPRK